MERWTECSRESISMLMRAIDYCVGVISDIGKEKINKKRTPTSTGIRFIEQFCPMSGIYHRYAFPILNPLRGSPKIRDP